MADKSPQQLLRESLERNEKQLEQWPQWMRRAFSTENIFSVPSPRESSPRRHGHGSPSSSKG